jgi:hypothetical protein
VSTLIRNVRTHFLFSFCCLLIENQSGITHKMKKNQGNNQGGFVLLVASAQKRILELPGEMDENDDDKAAHAKNRGTRGRGRGATPVASGGGA